MEIYDLQMVKVMLKLATRNSAEDLYIRRYPSQVIVWQKKGRNQQSETSPKGRDAKRSPGYSFPAQKELLIQDLRLRVKR